MGKEMKIKWVAREEHPCTKQGLCFPLQEIMLTLYPQLCQSFFFNCRAMMSVEPDITQIRTF